MKQYTWYQSEKLAGGICDRRVFHQYTSSGATSDGNLRTGCCQGTKKQPRKVGRFFWATLKRGGVEAQRLLVEKRGARMIVDRMQLARNASTTKCHPTRRAMTQWPLIYTVLGHRSVAAISNLDHGCGIPTNKGAKRCPLVLERGHRSPEHRQRRLRHRTSSSGIWLR